VGVEAAREAEAAVVLGALVASESYPALPGGMRTFLSSGDMSIQSAVLYSGSLDCLVGSRVGLRANN